MKMRYAALAAVAAMVLAVGGAVGAGYFPNFPIVQGESYCASQVTGTNTAGTTNTICGQTVPAGPSALTGTERVLADLSPTTSTGAPPATVSIPVGLFVGGTPAVIASMVNGGTIAMSPNQGALVMTGNSTVATATTVTLPAALYDQQRFNLSSNVSFSSLTVNTPSGYSLTNAPTAMTISATAPYGYSWIFNRATTTWYRLM